MSLWTSPVTFTVNTIARIFNFRAQLPDDNAVVGEWIEPAAALAAASKFTVKHSTRTNLIRSLLQYSCKKTVADGVTLKPMTCNFTIICDPEHTAVQQDEVIDMMKAAISDAGFNANFSLRVV
jgi:hypothetical protein